MHDHKNEEVQAEIPTETLDLLYGYKAQFTKQINFSQSRKERLEKLMIRRSAGKWSSEKRERMMRRHMTATTQLEQSVSLLDQVNFRLEQLLHVKPQETTQDSK